MDFETRFKKLNKNQQLAVTTTEGPVMVVAGPGTGKTELLGMRVAYILKTTDVLPENILCLTFTDSGSIAMRKRLVEIIGEAAYRVSIYTFHAFGSEIINQHKEYFYSGASFALADDIKRRQIVESIIDEMEYDNPLKTRMNGEYTNIGNIIGAISDLKRASLTPEEFESILNAISGSISIIEPLVAEAIEGRISKQTADKLANVLAKIESIEEPRIISTIPTFVETFRRGLASALDEAYTHEKVTPPLTAWKAEWTTNDANKNKILKASKHVSKLIPLAKAYRAYLDRMNEAELYDYDDMIMQTVHALENHQDLLLDLQEKYQYIMVDEFQDTNLAQMRILNLLTDNPVHEGNPNILTVGDDDQAIYGFQGADIGNILSFKETYPDAKIITLVDNYRSTALVLEGAQAVISQGGERLVNRLEGLDKTLTAHKQAETKTVITETLTPDHERQWVTEHIKNKLAQGVEPEEIAVISNKHAQLEALAPYLIEAGVPVSYDRVESVLDDEVVVHLMTLARTVDAIAKQEHDLANSLLPEILANPAWGISPTDVWRMSIRAKRDRKSWMEIMIDQPETKDFTEWLIAAAAASTHTPLEKIFDILTGEASFEEDGYVSPLKEHYFSNQRLESHGTDYVTHLSNLTAIRDKFREHSGSEKRTQLLSDFLVFIDQIIATKTNITKTHTFQTSENSVQLMSAHKSKGLEFDVVYILNATDAAWGEKARGGRSGLSYPENLRLRQSTGSYDERIRLFFVAMTRAKQELYISYPIQTDTGSENLKASFLINATSLADNIASADVSEEVKQTTAELIWHRYIGETPQQELSLILQPILENYKLSVTHVNRYLDVSRGGPRNFLLTSLLRFPSAMHASANYGNAVHASLQFAHEKTIAGHPFTIEDVINYFNEDMTLRDFEENEREELTTKGQEALRQFLEEKLPSFNANQRTELDFARQNVFLGEAHLTGKLDVVELDDKEKTAKIIDYKTGKPLTSWGKGSVYEKLKSHLYRQQLLFYHLLLKNSRDWRGHDILSSGLEFVEPTDDRRVATLAIEDFNQEEIERFTKIVCIVWTKIQNSDFPDTSHYSPDYKGVAQFEEDLLSGNI